VEINVKEMNSYSREMTVHVPWAELEDSFNKHAKKFSKKVNLRGFRPGKVPMKVLLKQFKPAMEADFVEHALNLYYLQALKEKDLLPVNKAEVEKVDFEHEGDMSFTAKFEIEPDIKLPKLRKRAFKVQKTIYVHDQEDIDNVIRDLRRNHATMETVETGAEEGNFILADLQKVDPSGLPIIGKKLEKQYLKVGGGVIKDENLDKLKGAKPEDKIRMHLPENEQGEKSEYEVTVINVEKEVLPEINEEFIKKVDPEAKTEEELRANVETRIVDNYQQRSQEAFERQLSDAMIEKVNPEFPPSMVESYLDHMVEDIKKSGQAGAEDVDEAKVRETYQSVAERNMKWFLVRKAIINENEFAVTKDDVQAEIQKLLDRSPNSAKEIEKYYKKPSNRTRIEDDLMEKKILDYLQQFAKIKEVEVKTKDLRQQEAHEHG
jgi:trigger factor